MTSAHFLASHSIIQLDAHHPYAARALIDAQHMHRTVMSGFRGWVEDGAPDARAQMGILSTWQLDLKNRVLLLIVQARVSPDWNSIPSDALVAPITTMTIDRKINTGETVAFRTVVNPTSDRTVTISTRAGRQAVRRRLPHTTPAHVRTWFAERLQEPGASRTGPGGRTRIGAYTDPTTLAIRTLPPVTSNGPHKGLKIGRAEIKGRLTVTDPSTFVEALTSGIGRAKAYSCGLILTRPTTE